MNYAQVPGSAGMLPMTAGAIAVYQSLWLGIAVTVIGATLITVSKLFPRVAVEPVRQQGGHRLGLTVNGRPARPPRWLSRILRRGDDR